MTSDFSDKINRLPLNLQGKPFEFPFTSLLASNHYQSSGSSDSSGSSGKGQLLTQLDQFLPVELEGNSG